MDSFVEIGRLGKPHGVDGALKVFIEEPFWPSFQEAPVVFLELRGGKVPHFIGEIREANALLVVFDEVDTREAAVELAGKSVYLRSADILPSAGRNATMADYLQYVGYTIVDRVAGLVGVVEDVLELPQQYVAVVPYQGREVLIPLNDQLLLAVDEGARLLEMDLPEGLLEL